MLVIEELPLLLLVLLLDENLVQHLVDHLSPYSLHLLSP